MALVEAGRFFTLGEAQIARSALEAADIPAFVCDEYLGAAAWHYSASLNGFRVLVPEEWAGEARRELGAVAPAAPPEASVSRMGGFSVWGGLAAIAMAIGGGVLFLIFAPVMAVLAYLWRRPGRRARLED